MVFYTYHYSSIWYHIVASHLTWGSVITVAVGQTNGGLSDCGLPHYYETPLATIT